MTDVNDIVQKFLTWEQTYSQLLVAVSDAEKRMEWLWLDHDNGKEVLHQLMMNWDNLNQKQAFPEAAALNDEIQRL